MKLYEGTQQTIIFQVDKANARKKKPMPAERGEKKCDMGCTQNPLQYDQPKGKTTNSQNKDTRVESLMKAAEAEVGVILSCPSVSQGRGTHT